jgi:magnesium and cobalt transporter
VYNKRVDDIIGYVYYRDILEHEGEIESIRSIMRKAVYVPLTKSLYVLYREMQNSKNYIVFAVNEFGAVVGMVSREDIAEEIVGEIQTRDHSRVDLVLCLEDGSCSIAGVLDVDIFARKFDIEIEKKGFETVGGFVCYLAGKIPDEGTVFDYQKISMTVESSNDKTVKRIRVDEKKPKRKKRKTA